MSDSLRLIAAALERAAALIEDYPDSDLRLNEAVQIAEDAAHELLLVSGSPLEIRGGEAL